jgi:hypothetical protein
MGKECEEVSGEDEIVEGCDGGIEDGIGRGGAGVAAGAAAAAPGTRVGAGGANGAGVGFAALAGATGGISAGGRTGAVAAEEAATGVVVEGETAGGVAGAAAAAAGPAFLRKSPRATRNVPRACSIAIGFVSTRFAPIRKAAATPACPSTNATISEAALDTEFRAVFSRRLAFSSLWQSTTTASNAWVVNFLTAAKVSEHGSTWKSSSFRTCVMVRAFFSSWQNKRAK